jgi:ABC-2 type transport system permease protein
MSVANNIAYAGETALRGLFLLLLIYVFVQLWHTTYGALGVPTLGGFDVAQMVWYFAFAEAIIMSSPRSWGKIDREVKSGDLAYRLNKPYHYLGYLAAEDTGERLVRFLLNLAIGAVVCLALVGPIAFEPLALLTTLPLLVGAWALDFLGSCLVGLLSFWIEDTFAFSFIYNRLVLLLGGTLLPLNLFPDPIRGIAEWLPFGSMVYGPARNFVHFDPAFFGDMLLRQIITIAIFTTIALLTFRAGTRRVNINGG